MCVEKFDNVFSQLQSIAVSIDKSREEGQSHQVTTDHSNTKKDNLLSQIPSMIRSNIITAILCVIIAILVSIILLSPRGDLDNDMTELRQQIVLLQDTLDLVAVDKNDTCKNKLVQAKLQLSELENNIKNLTVKHKEESRQAKLLQTKLENDIKSLKSNKPKQKNKSIQDEQVQDKLNKLNYLWHLAMNIYKSCAYLYDHMSSNKIYWTEMMFLCNEMSLHGDQVAPVVVKMSNYTNKMMNRERWYSSPFFAFEEGHKVQIRVDAAVYGDGEVTHDHVFVYLLLVKGPYDDGLLMQQTGDWPIKGTFTIELLNQLNDSDHRSSEVSFTCGPMVCDFKAIERYLAKGRLTPHETICYQITSNYLQNDSLYFRVSYKDTRYDYYYFLYFVQYFVLPATAMVGIVTVMSVVERKRIKASNIIVWSTSFIVGSLLVGNLLGGMLWAGMTSITIVLMRKVWKKRIGTVHRTVFLCMATFSSVLIKLLLVGVLSMPWGIVWYIV